MIDHVLKSFGPFCLVFLFCGIFGAAKVHASETWTLPVEPELKTLRITNLTSQTQSVWIGSPARPEVPAVNFQIRAYATEIIPLIEWRNLPWLKVFAETEKVLQIQIDTSSETTVLLNSGDSNRWKVRSRNQSELVIYNLFSDAQKIQISAPGEPTLSLELQALEKIRLPLKDEWSNNLLTISAESWIGGFMMSASGPRAWVPASSGKP